MYRPRWMAMGHAGRCYACTAGEPIQRSWNSRWHSWRHGWSAATCTSWRPALSKREPTAFVCIYTRLQSNPTTLSLVAIFKVEKKELELEMEHACTVSVGYAWTYKFVDSRALNQRGVRPDDCLHVSASLLCSLGDSRERGGNEWGHRCIGATCRRRRGASRSFSRGCWLLTGCVWLRAHLHSSIDMDHVWDANNYAHSSTPNHPPLVSHPPKQIMTGSAAVSVARAPPGRAASGGARRGPGAAARHSQFARVQGRTATERFSAQLPRAHWTGPE